jgi:outer membrane protein OmpA-like peptidoglycan-associated protein
MKLKLSVGILVLLMTSFVKAQGLLGIHQSDYNGLHSLYAQPANSTDNRYKLDVNFLGMNVMVYNNFLSLSAANVWKVIGGAADENLWENDVSKRFNGKPKSVFINTEVMLPSVMVALNEKESIAFLWRNRTYMNVDGIDDPLAKLAIDDFGTQDLWLQSLQNEYLSIQTMSWVEYGFNYSRVMYDEGEHFVKAGTTVKLLQGLAAAYMQVEDLKYEFYNEDTVTILQSDIYYGHSPGFDPFNPAEPFKNYKFDGRPGLGLDIGVVYEWRPDWKDYKYEMDGRDNIWRKDKNKYKARAGFSITDLGWIRYKKGAESGDFKADVSLWNFRNIKATEMQDINDTLFSKFIRQPNDKDFFRMTMPAAVTLYGDYNIWKYINVNAMAFIAINRKKDPNRVHHFTNFSITPSFDTRWFGFAVPISYSPYTTFRAGMGFRAGPVFFGTSDIRLLTGGKNLYGADFYLALKMPLFHRHPKDKDMDKVSDEFDICKELPGVWTFKGCPDSDGDLIQDTQDDCPAEAGLVEFNGCPDTDRDGIPDKKDDCPTIAGPLEFNGCPDADGDSIIDKKDKCPKVKGLAKFDGCPDTDEDGIQDSEDDCPEEAGPETNFGCPERVKLHLVDPLGNIIASVAPDENGKFVFKNLPLDRTYLFLMEGFDDSELKTSINVIIRNIDGEHVIVANLEDSGFFVYRYIAAEKQELELIEVEEPVLIVLTTEEEEIVKRAFDNLEFATGKSIIKQDSYESLNELADLLEKKPEWKLQLDGHTDNVGAAASNLILSRKRAEAVKFFLTQRGIADDRIHVNFWGQTKPIGDNTTDEGRQKNRRVEMKIVD